MYYIVCMIYAFQRTINIACPACRMLSVGFNIEIHNHIIIISTDNEKPANIIYADLIIRQFDT